MNQTALALLGGTPSVAAGPPPWPRALPVVKAALDVAFTTGDWGRYHGAHVCALEDALAAMFSVNHALTCASGTLAVDVALKAVGVKPGGEVILGAYEYESNFLTVVALGAKPVLVDSLAGNTTLDPSQLSRAITPATQAILATHLHGGMVNLAAIRALAPGIPLVEDAAQAIGARVNGALAGTVGDVGILSFGGSKLITAGRGGALLTRDVGIYQRAKLHLTRGVQQWGALSELQAAVIQPQLQLLEADTVTRSSRVTLLLSHIANIPLVPFQNHHPCTPGYYKLGFRYPAKEWGVPRELFCKAMRAEGVAMDPGFAALHRSRAPSRFQAVGPLDNATQWHDECVMLHHPVLLGEEELETVARAIQKVYRERESLKALIT